MSVTIILIAITCIVSYLAFQNKELQNKLVLYPVVMRTPAQAYRLITSGFIHADTMHLLFNMLTLYFFGDMIEQALGMELFVMLYLSGIVVANLPSYYKQMSNPQFSSLGASGGVAAIVFAFIYIMPWQKICLFFAICLPAIIFAVGYLIYSFVMGKKSGQRINHDAHFIGSIYGLVFMLIVDPTHGADFIQRLMNP